MSEFKTVENFNAHVSQIKAAPGYRQPIGFGLCRIEKGQLHPEKILSCTFPVINWGANYGSAAAFQHAAGLTDHVIEGPEIVTSVTEDFLCAALDVFAPFLEDAKGEKHRNVQVIQTLHKLVKNKGADLSNYRFVFIYADDKPLSVPAVYLKLLALSTGAAPLRSLNLEGIFATLENAAWAGGKPIELDWLRQNEIALKLEGNYPAIDFVDKFPRYLQHIIPADNTRILDASKVRLGAYLGAGTTVMAGASYVNFNAGTLSNAMVEGRISSSAIVDEGTDIGGGASILGILSGGNKVPITIGKECLLGANSVTGISLGDGCIVDAGVSILAGTRVFMTDESKAALVTINPEGVIATSKHPLGMRHYEFKAAALAGCNGMHFRVDSATGRTMVMRSAKKVVLNAALHAAP